MVSGCRRWAATTALTPSPLSLSLTFMIFFSQPPGRLNVGTVGMSPVKPNYGFNSSLRDYLSEVFDLGLAAGELEGERERERSKAWPSVTGGERGTVSSRRTDKEHHRDIKWGPSSLPSSQPLTVAIVKTVPTGRRSRIWGRLCISQWAETALTETPAIPTLLPPLHRLQVLLRRPREEALRVELEERDRDSRKLG